MEVRVFVIAIAIVAGANLPVVVGAPGWWTGLTGTGTSTGNDNSNGNSNGNGKDKPKSDTIAGGFIDNQMGQLTASVFKNSGIGKTLSQRLNDMGAFGDSFESTLDSTFRFFDASTSAVFGECDAQELITLIRPYLKLDSIPFTECLRGFKVDLTGTSVTMNPGYLNYDETKFNIEGFSGEGYHEDTKELHLSFEFKDLQFVYDFVNGYLKMSRTGQVVFDLAGTSKVLLRVRIPSQSAQVKKAMENKGTCFVDVRQVYVDLPSTLKVNDIQYDSFVENNTKQGVTVYSINKMANNPNISVKIKEIVKEALKKMLEPVINDGTIFCDPRRITTVKDPKCEAKDIIDLTTVKLPVL